MYAQCGTSGLIRVQRGQASGAFRNALARGVVTLAMLRFIILATLVIVFASASLAGLGTIAAAHHPKPIASAEKDSFSFTGTVASVDYAANVVELTTNGR